MKRSLSLVLVLALVLGMFSAFALFAGAEAGAGETPAPTEPETPAAPVEIATAEDFAAMKADGNYILTADITVAATYASAFTGTFDGNGKTITTSVVLFKTLTGATIKNLTVAGEVTVKDNRAAAIAREGSKMTFENVINNANINATKKGSYMGGFVAQGATGGGTETEREKTYFTNCVNNGNITFNGDGTPRVGGFIGNVAKYQYGVYTNCVNNGKVSVTGTGLTKSPYVAGIAGSSFGGEFTNCTNNGDIYCNGASAHMGGILGRGTPSCQGGDQSSKAVGCVNTGNLTIEGATGGTVGGILGHCHTDPGETVTYAIYSTEKCVNTGTLTSSGTQVGGMIGYVWGSNNETKYAYAVIRNCVNLGKLVGTKNAAPETEPDTTFFRATYLSHFVGYVNASSTVIENSYGLGTLENTNDDYNVIFGLSSDTALNFHVNNIVLAPNDGTKNFAYGHDAMVTVKDDAGNDVQVLDDRSRNRVTIAAYQAMEGKAGNVVNDKKVYVVDGTEGKTLADAITAVADGEYIVLMTDVTLSDNVTVTKANVSFTIDGMGHKIAGGKKVVFATANGTVNLKNLTIEGAIHTDDNTAGVTLVLTDCELTSKNEYGLRVTAGNKMYINSGKYTTSGKDSCLEVRGEGTVCEVRGGQFYSNKNCAARAYDKGTLNIYGGEFYYTASGATVKGSAIRGGTGSNGGTVNIYGGTFSSKGQLYAVINAVHKDGVVNIVAGKFINAGEGTIAVFEKLDENGNRVNVIEFPEGQKEYVLEAPTPPDTDTENPGGTTTENPGGNTTTENKPGDTTTENKPGDNTTENKPGDNTTTESKPTDSNKPGDTTTGATEEGGCNGCGGFAAAAQVVALLVGVVGVALVVKRK